MIGRTLGPYLLESELGQGGMGVVYRARDQRLDRAVAIKILPERLGRDAAARERFQREARAISAVNHPGICTLYDVGETEGGQPFLVMELLQGETLQQRLRRGALAPEEARAIGLQVAGALEAAHRRGMIHRDLKPGNIFLAAGGQAKLLDFGLAKMVDAAAASPPVGDDAPTLTTPGSSDLTQPGLAVGTIAYMSPEQALGKPLDPRSDIFSLGLVLYEMLAGQVAFPGTTSAAVFDGILNRTPPPLRERVIGCTSELEQAVATALEKDPARRYASAGALREALRGGPAGPSGGASPAADARRPTHPRRWAAAAAIVVLLLGGGFYWWSRRGAAIPVMGSGGTLVLADFTNSTGDAMFDGALRQGLEVQLQQSPYLHIISDQRMAAEEQLMGLKPDTPVRGAVATQLCIRTGSAAALEGTIAQIGSQYSLTLEALRCSNGDSLASVGETAADKNHVLAALGRMASSMRAKLGESLTSMSQFDTPIEQVTTPSLPALRAYSRGRQQLVMGNYAGARDMFTQALALDPNFAMAYASRGTAESDLNQPDAADFTAAYQRRNQVSQHERLYITAHYDDSVVGDLVKAENDYRAWATTYPDDPVPLLNLCALESKLGQNAEGLADAQAAYKLDPSNVISLVDLAGMEALNGHGSRARSQVEAALRRQPGNLAMHELAYQLAVWAPAPEAAASQLAWLQAQPAAAPFLGNETALEELRGGRLQALRGALRAGGGDASSWLSLALQEAILGARTAARQDAATALAHTPGATDQATAALVFAMTGAVTRAETLDTRLQQDDPSQTVLEQIELPINRAWVALARQQPRAALTLLAPALPYERTQAAVMLPAYTRGLALMALRQPAAAAAAFQQVIAYPLDGGLRAPSYVQLARAQAALGHNAAARGSYANSLRLLAQADADLALVEAARNEAKKLSSGR